jgi:acyl-CoA reductase-like NAD-dependent aldehyde dehydrogenase
MTTTRNVSELRHASMLIGERWRDATSGLRIDVESPVSRAVVGTVPRGDAEDVELAVRAAEGALPSWRDTAPRERGRMLGAAATRVLEEAESLAQLLATETGNAIRTQSRPEAIGAADMLRYFGSVASELKGEVVPLGGNLLNYTTREPYGVIGAIVAWNSPLLLSATKVGMATMTGNTVVLKAPEDAPLAVVELVRLCAEHLPPGVINVITGFGEEAGRALVRHEGVAKISFTGSTEVGREIASVAGARVVPTLLELGGKSPAIVCADSDSDAVADGVIAGMRFTRQGQGCTAGSRLFVHESIFASFTSRLAARLSALKVGDPLDEETDIGAVINQTQFDKICGYITEGIDAGATVITGGLQKPDNGFADGLFLAPTVLSDLPLDSRLFQEEIFGPVLVARPWSTEGEVIALANDTSYGLSAYVWCRELSQALRMARAIQAGGVQINRGFGPVPGMSSGGIKQSGFGREHSLEGALDDFTYRKTVTIGIGD